MNMAHIVPNDVSNYSDFVIDEILARCSDDMHFALKALLLINEDLGGRAKPAPQRVGLRDTSGPPYRLFAALTRYQGVTGVDSPSGFGRTDRWCAPYRNNPVAD